MPISYYFSFHGSVSSVEFKNVLLKIISVEFIIGFLSSFADQLLSPILSILVVVFSLSQISFVIRRLHDANVSKALLIKFLGVEYFITYFFIHLWGQAVQHFSFNHIPKLSNPAIHNALIPYANLRTYSPILSFIVLLMFLVYVYKLPTSSCGSSTIKLSRKKTIIKYIVSFILITILINVISSIIVSVT